MIKLKSCEYKGKNYTHGSDLCKAERCMKCDDGEWKSYSKSL